MLVRTALYTVTNFQANVDNKVVLADEITTTRCSEDKYGFEEFLGLRCKDSALAEFSEDDTVETNTVAGLLHIAGGTSSAAAANLARCCRATRRMLPYTKTSTAVVSK